MVPQHLKNVILHINDLPTLPRTILRISELVNNPKTSAKDLAKVITDDQVLTARLLKLVNSSFYGFPQKISTVTGAIVLLGFDAIRNLLLTTSVCFPTNTKPTRNCRKSSGIIPSVAPLGPRPSEGFSRASRWRSFSSLVCCTTSVRSSR